MGKITNNTVKHVAKLSALPLKEKEISKFQKELSRVIDYIDNLNDINTSNTEPTSQTTGLTNVLRDDVIDEKVCLPVGDATSGTENIHNNLFKVPMVLKERSDK